MLCKYKFSVHICA